MLIYDLTFEELVRFLEEKGYKKYRASQIWHWLYKQKASAFSEMNNIPQEIITLLESHFKF